MRKKFKIFYPQDYHEVNKQGKLYKPLGKCMVVMNGPGVFFVYNGEEYYPSIKRLSEILPKYDVVWVN